MFLLAAPPVFASRGLVLCSWVYVEGREGVSENWSLFLMQWSSLSLLLPLVWSHLSEIDTAPPAFCRSAVPGVAFSARPVNLHVSLLDEVDVL